MGHVSLKVGLRGTCTEPVSEVNVLLCGSRQGVYVGEEGTWFIPPHFPSKIPGYNSSICCSHAAAGIVTSNTAASIGFSPASLLGISKYAKPSPDRRRHHAAQASAESPQTASSHLLTGNTQALNSRVALFWPSLEGTGARIRSSKTAPHCTGTPLYLRTSLKRPELL